MVRDCTHCECASGAVNGRPEELLCASHPDHAGRLVVVAGGAGLPDEAGPRCRSFRLRREPVEIGAAGVDDTVRYINLAGGLFAIVDAVDYEGLSKHHWRAFGTSTGYYACCTIKGRPVFMHRLIMDPPEGFVVDHINANKQDNRRCNLRVCTQAENLRNNRKGRGTSRFKGVSWNSACRKWVAKIYHNGKTTELGRFDDEIEAARAYDRAARQLFGPFAYLNFPQWGNIVRLSGRICASSRVRGHIRILKSEIRIPKSETNPNDRTSKFETEYTPLPAFRSLEHLNFGDCFGFRISCFVLFPARGPPGCIGNHALKALD